MARINSNIASLIARSNLEKANDDLAVRMQRLATGIKINRGADDPAGLIISERLRSEIRGIEQGVKNSERASAVIATTEGSLAEVSELLNSIQALVVEAANTGALSDEEREANQLQIDSAIDSITRISNSASFGGLKLLNGELDYILSGIASSAISKAQVFGANFAGQPSIEVETEVLTSAQTGRLYFQNNPTSPTLTSDVTLAISGREGVQEIRFISGTAMADVIGGINAFTEATGVSATLVSAANPTSGIVFSSTGYGSDAFVAVERIADGQNWATVKVPDGDPIDDGADIWAATTQSGTRDSGQDVVALVNGVVASGKGLELSLNNSTSISIKLLLNVDLATRPGQSTTFDITGGGALFQLGGEVSLSQQTNLGVQSMAATRLGGTLVGTNLEFLSSLKSGGANDLRSRHFTVAGSILDTAIDESSVMRGRLGAFEKNTLDTNVRSLQSALENLVASDSIIRDADFAAETAALSRAQVLNSSSTSVLGLANQQAQAVLQLLG